MPPFGKYIFIWRVPDLLSGDPQRIGEAALEAGIQTIIIKFVDGKFVYRPTLQWGDNLRKEHVELWQGLGLRVWGYAYLRGDDPSLEAGTAADEALRLGLEGVAFDVEIEFETAQVIAADAGEQVQFIPREPRVSLAITIRSQLFTILDGQPIPTQALIKAPFEAQANPVGNAHTYMQEFKARAPGMKTAFICFPLFRSPNTGGTWHNKPMYAAFMQYCDFGMPMTYWWGSTIANMLWMLNHSLTQWGEIAQGKPILPIGRLYSGDGGTATAEAIAAFGKELYTRGLIGGGGWRFGTGLAITAWWSAFTNWPTWQIQPPPGPPVVPLEEWARQADGFLRTQGYTGPRPPQP